MENNIIEIEVNKDFLTKSNNWLHMHGAPMRRRKFFRVFNSGILIYHRLAIGSPGCGKSFWQKKEQLKDMVSQYENSRIINSSRKVEI